MLIVWASRVEARNERGRPIEHASIAHCVARYAREGDPCRVEPFSLEQRVSTPFGEGLVLRIDEDGYLGVLLDKPSEWRSQPKLWPDQTDLLYLRYTLCEPIKPRGRRRSR